MSEALNSKSQIKISTVEAILVLAFCTAKQIIVSTALLDIKII